MSDIEKAIKYLKNNNGVIRKNLFIEDFSPIGQSLINELISSGIAHTLTSGQVTIIALSDDNACTDKLILSKQSTPSSFKKFVTINKNLSA